MSVSVRPQLSHITCLSSEQYTVSDWGIRDLYTELPALVDHGDGWLDGAETEGMGDASLV